VDYNRTQKKQCELYSRLIALITSFPRPRSIIERKFRRGAQQSSAFAPRGGERGLTNGRALPSVVEDNVINFAAAKCWNTDVRDLLDISLDYGHEDGFSFLDLWEAIEVEG
jgi:hypothetical protein